MIKKTTTATFKDGQYAGEYDWQGGIPLSVGETITVTVAGTEKLDYTLVAKKTTLDDSGQDQTVTISYTFELAQ
jgi:hypothetical protein